MKILIIKIGLICKTIADSIDAGRTKRQERRRLSSTKDARLARKQQLIDHNEMYEKAEDLFHGPEIAD
ncbi:hypothetical protein EAI_01805 [Harpegnathos saltator]|uniref:Uncharacterized protein n=1 Tax=Harpegnathos saltator TaxID=610380 RepID=E2BBV1_HARSA|nr:hypothetical protein EAI_01805 [Harpegnathos saltator]